MVRDDLVELVSIEIDSTEQTLGNIESLRRLIVGRPPNVHEMTAFAAYVRDAYTGLENILSRFARHYGVSIPDGGDRHSQLLKMFSDPPADGLPLLLPQSLHDRIQEYRGFRHVFNKRYSAHLDWRKLRPLVEDASVTFRTFHALIQSVLKSMSEAG